MPQLSIVVPVYREEENIRPFLARAETAVAELGATYEIIFALDPSPDGTEQRIADELRRNPNIKLLVFSRRFGQPAATMAGVLACTGDACVVIDVDLQDPPELIPVLYRTLQTGYDVVYAKRRSRRGETLAKRAIARMGYAVINRLSDLRIPRDTGDYRIISRRVIEELRRLNESHGFLRGLVAYVGFPQTSVEYDRDARSAGAGKYSRLTGSVRIGLNGLIGFSSRPLQVMSVAGFALAGFSFLLGGWYVFQRLVGMELSPGLPTIVLVVTFFSGVQLIALGLMGEYVGRIYDEVKRRPMFIVDKRINFQDGRSGSPDRERGIGNTE